MNNSPVFFITAVLADSTAAADARDAAVDGDGKGEVDAEEEEGEPIVVVPVGARGAGIFLI